MKAENRIDLNIDNKGKGRRFESRFLQAGLVKYSFGVCLLSKEVIDRFAYKFVGCPVIIDHKDITDENAKDERVGVISKVWFNEFDGWFWCEGVVFDDEAISLIKDKGYNVSCQYNIDDYTENSAKALHNGNPYDITILDGTPEHLAIVKSPRYEEALIAVNKGEDMEDIKAENGFITIDEIDPLTGKRRVIWIPGNVISKTALKRVKEVMNAYKEGDETKYDFSHTRVKPTEEQIKYIKDTVNEITRDYKFKGVAQVEISSELNKGSLGVCYSPDNCSLISLSPQLYNGKHDQARWENGVKSGFHPSGTGEMIKSVLVHELGHAITCNSNNKEFWNAIEKVRTDYMKNISKKDIDSPDFISNYARTNKYEFVAEAFSQGRLSKKYGKYTKQVMDLMNEHFASSKQLKLATNKEDENDIWMEEYGFGYPIDEDVLKDFESKQDRKEDNNKAKNELVEQLERFVSLVAKNFDESKHKRDEDGKFTDSGNFSGKTVDEQEKELVKELKRLEKNGRKSDEVAEIYKKLTGKEWQTQGAKKEDKKQVKKSQKIDDVKFDKIGKVLPSILKYMEKVYKESK